MKNKLNTFFSTFKNSAFKPSYYKNILKAPFSFSLKFFLFLFLALSFLTVVAASIFLVQRVNPFINQLKTQLPSFYPTELVIEIKNGEVKTNVAEPYFVSLDPEWFPQEIREALKTQPLQNIIVIDTQAQPTDIRKYQTFALLTKNDLAVIAENNEIRINSLEEIKDFTLNQEMVKTGWQAITPYFKWIIPASIVLLLIFIPIGTIMGKLIYLLIISVLSWILSLLFRPKLEAINYGKALQVNLHAITLPTIIIALFQFLGVQPQIPFFQSIILLIFNLIIFSSLREKKLRS